MTDNKILTPAEALLALGEGRKLTRPKWPSTSFVYLSDNGDLKTEGLEASSYITFMGFQEYKEPKSKRKFAPYVLLDQNDIVFMPYKFFENDEPVKISWPGAKIVRRVTELEIEIE